MTLLKPLYTYQIPVHIATQGWDVLRLAVEKHCFPPPALKPRYKIAFLWTHGTGFHKEMLHPLMRRFIEQLRPIPRYSDIHIDFYAWDHRCHGDSARLSKDAAWPRSVSWYEVGLDTLQVINEFKLKQKYDKVIGVGHSMGGTSMLLAEHMYPKTFDAICAIDPVMRDKIIDHKTSSSMTPERLTLKRRDTWPNRYRNVLIYVFMRTRLNYALKSVVCYHSLRNCSLWRTWDGEVLENFVV
ncbi:Alpha/Beta hydrolase protein [Fennellomyces sp. T-0311]|nr:Alpha/Beta hydrolase protein [Fennellomyces sp. T-0311]